MNAVRAPLPRFLAVALVSALAAACSDDGTLNQTGFGSTDGDDSTSGSGAITITMSSSISEGSADPTEGDTDAPSSSSDPSSASATTASTTSATTDGTGGQDPVAATIYEIQDETISPGTLVLVQGVSVTGLRDGIGLYVQETGGGERSGIYVDTGDIDISGLAVGDLLDITGVALEPSMGALADLTQIDASSGTVVDTGNDMVVTPETVALSVVGDPVAAEPWECVLVTVDEASAVAVEAENNFDEFQLGDGTDAVWVDDFLFNVYDDAVNFPGMGVGATFMSVTGPLNYSFGDFKLTPRTATDLVGYVGPDVTGMTVEDLSPGDLVVTEIMYDPAVCNDTDCEYIEVFNASGAAVNLNGLIIRDESGGMDTVTADATIPDGGYAVIGQTPWGYQTFSPLIEMGMPTLNNNNGGGGTADFVVISNSTQILDQTAAWTAPATISADDGYAWKLDVAPDATDNDSDTNWCYSANPLEGSDFGSPGVANVAGCTAI